MCPPYEVTDREILRIIGKNIRGARLQSNLTQECLAELVGVHWHTIHHAETGKVPISVATFTRISQVLQTSTNRLIDGVPEPDSARIERIKKAMARRRKPKGA
jgi:DNA-binding XRE family transcriptional regulator